MEGLTKTWASNETVQSFNYDTTLMELYLEHLVATLEFGDELYGLKLAVEYGLNSEQLDTYLRVQEFTHIQEGIELSQKDSTDFPFNGHNVLSPLTGEPMVEIGKEGHKAQKELVTKGKGLDFMVIRTRHDIVIAEDNDERMKERPIGSTWFRITPYEEEADDTTAAKAGMFPKQKRSFIWLYRKKDAQTLETSIITVDQSSVAAFAGLMNEYGVRLPVDVMSHDVPRYAVEIEDLVESTEQRDKLIAQLQQRYIAYAQVVEDPAIKLGSKEFLEQFAFDDIESIVRLQKEIILSLGLNKVSPFTKAATVAVLKQNFITDDERRSIKELINSGQSRSHLQALKLVMKAHRYGVWEAVNKRIEAAKTDVERPASVYIQELPPEYILGQEITNRDKLQLNQNSQQAQSAAEQGKVKPGCPGGSSFLSQDMSEAKESIFGDQSGKKWMSCPFCKKDKAVYAEVCAKDLKCRHCTAEVKNGKVVSSGRGQEEQGEDAKIKRQAEKEARQKQQAEMAKKVNEAFKDQGIESFEAERQQVAQTSGSVAVGMATV